MAIFLISYYEDLMDADWLSRPRFSARFPAKSEAMKGTIMRVAVSACLLGKNCKYDGGNNFHERVANFVADKEILPVCPEILVMPVPRPPVELVAGRAVDERGRDVDALYREGVRRTLAEIEKFSPNLVILKARSPTCGVHEIYDGTFSHKKIPQSGLLARALLKRGYCVIDEEELEIMEASVK